MERLQTSAYGKPLPVRNRLNGPFWEGTLRGELRIQRCTRCDERWFPPATHCPKCLSREVEWVTASGRGRVWSWIVMHQRYFQAFEHELPYNVAMIELEEGPVMMSSLVEVEADQIRCDMPVTVRFEEATEEMSVPKFRPAQA